MVEPTTMPEPTNATQWGVRAADTDRIRVYINGQFFDFDPRGAADLAQTIRVILGVEERAERAAAEETDAVSDGYHTFGELYDHRRALTAALAKALSLDSWRSKAHHPDDSPMFEGGYFIVGINLPTGTITYHYKLSHWDDFAGVIELAHAPKWDGAPPPASVDRLLAWASAPASPDGGE